MKKGTKRLYNCIKEHLKENELIYILRENEVNEAKGIMHEFTYDQIFNNYSDKEIVKSYWHEDGLCIILNK